MENFGGSWVKTIVNQIIEVTSLIWLLSLAMSLGNWWQVDLWLYLAKETWNQEEKGECMYTLESLLAITENMLVIYCYMTNHLKN